MTKQPAISRVFSTLGLALALVTGFRSLSRADAPPPPPFVNPDAPAAPAINPGGEASVGSAPAATPAKDPKDFNPDSMADSAVAAPTISDDQQIKNAMDMAMELFHAEDYDACVKATAAILDHYPKKHLYWVRYLSALSMEHEDLYYQAIPMYEKVREEAAHTTYANAAAFRVGLCQLKCGESGEAIYTLRDIIENNPRSEYRLQAYMHLGNLYRSGKRWSAAERIYKDIVHLYPNTSWAWTSLVYLAETYAHQGKTDIAIKVYGTLLRNPLVPEVMRAQAQLDVGDLYIADSRWLEALQTYRVALRDFSHVPGVAVTCEEKMKEATEGRRYGRVAYRQVKTGPRVITEGPEDENYRMKQEQEKVPYQ